MAMKLPAQANHGGLVSQLLTRVLLLERRVFALEAGPTGTFKYKTPDGLWFYIRPDSSSYFRP